MESKYRQGIERKIKEIAKDYKNKGYQVIIESNSNLVPEFLFNFQADLIALSDNDNVVVEVKSSDSRTDFKKLEELANIVNSREKWRFELVFTNPRDRLKIDSELNLIDSAEIEKRISECKSLLLTNSLESAFLLGWATLEASIRIKLKSINVKDVDIQKPPLHLIKNLFSFGIINQSFLRKLELLNQYRNKINHGFETNINKESVNSLIEIIELLTGKSVNSEIYDWISHLDLEGYEEIYCLYQSVAEIDEYGLFKAYKKGEHIFVKSDIMDEELELSNENKQKEMLEIIEEEYMDGMDSEGFYGFHRAMEKDD